MKLIITESQFKDFLRYSILGEASTILLENQEAKSFNKAVKLLVDKGYDKQEASHFISYDIRAVVSNLKTHRGGKYILGVTRLWANGELNDGQSRSQINTIIEVLVNDSQLYEEYDQDLNGLSLQKLVNTFSEAIKDMMEKDKQKLADKQYSNSSNYKIVRIDNFEQSNQYEPYCNWCITQEERFLYSESSNGFDQFYFCLRNGFENEPEVAGENCPLDSYGLSMIAVCVDENGRLSSCTTRWNNRNGGTMHALTTEQISDLIGRNFYDVFKPNNNSETALEITMKRLENGEDPEYIFDECDFSEYYNSGLMPVCLHKKWNILDDRKLLLKHWFDNIVIYLDEEFSHISVLVELGGKWNIISLYDGETLEYNQWFDRISIDHNSGYNVVRLNGKYNFIDEHGNYLSKQWFDNAYNFKENGYASVKLNGRWNFIDRQGNYLYDTWVDLRILRLRRNDKPKIKKTTKLSQE